MLIIQDPDPDSVLFVILKSGSGEESAIDVANKARISRCARNAFREAHGL
jgi:hypothetical protein